jgi:co-chaperonin GroES (HSP10)
MENKAEVISVGPDVKYVKAGDFVLFEDFNRINVELSDSSKGWMLSEDHILAIIKE